MDLNTLVTLSLGFMVSAFWLAPLAAIQDRINFKRHIERQVDRKIESASIALTDGNEMTDLSLNRIVSRFRSEDSGSNLDVANQTWKLLLMAKFDVACSVADFAIFEEIHRNNPAATESEKQKVEGFLATIVDIYVNHLNMERNDAIDIIREDVFFAFAQLDLDGMIDPKDTLVNLAEDFLQKSTFIEDTADKNN